MDEEGAQGCSIFFKDEDGDGYGVTGDTLCLCGPEAVYRAIQGGDSNDLDPFVFPGIYISKEMSLIAGWSMISLPVAPDNLVLSSLFPEALVVYGYDNGDIIVIYGYAAGAGYQRVLPSEDIGLGQGYWILFSNIHVQAELKVMNK